MRQSRMGHLAANTQALAGQLPGWKQRRERDHDPRHDHMLDTVGMVVKGLLLGEIGKPDIAISEVFGVGQSRAKNVGNDSRFDKQNSHVVASQGRVVFVAQGEANHCTEPYASSDHAFAWGESQNVTGHGERLVNIAETAGS